MYFPFSILYGVGFVADAVLFNLVEFWSGSNPIGLNEFDSKGTYTRVFQSGSDELKLSYSEFGKKLQIGIRQNGKSDSFVAFADQKEVLFRETSNGPVAIDLEKESKANPMLQQLIEKGLFQTKLEKDQSQATFSL